MEKIIVSLKELSESGKNVAFVSGNREISQKNVDAKVKSFKEFGENLVPLVFVEGTKAVEDGCKLMNPMTYEEIQSSDASKYVVIVDGQHRYKAIMQAGLDPSNVSLYKCTNHNDTRTLLAAMNYETKSWTAPDFANGALLMHPDNEFLIVLNDFIKKGFNCSTISKFLYFKGGLIKKAILSKMLAGEVVPDSSINIERAQQIYEAAVKKFDDKFLAKRYFIDAVIDKSNKIGSDNYLKIIDAINQMTTQTVKEIAEAKADNKESLINSYFNSAIR